MIRAGALLLLGGCNAAFGIEATELPPPDVLPTTCPPIGTTPRFSGTFRQVVAQACTDYSPSLDGDIAMGSCGFDIWVGPVDAPLTHLPLTPVNAFAQLKAPRVTPEGNVAFIDNNNFDNNSGDMFAEYDAVNATTWNLVGDTGIPHGTDLGATIGQVTRAPNRHVMWTNGKDGTLHELVQQGAATWSEVPTTAALGLTDYYTPASLTPDGLHLILRATGSSGMSIYYATRSSIDDPFGAAAPLSGIPDNVPDPVMTADCTRVYFTGVGRIFYVEQI